MDEEVSPLEREHSLSVLLPGGMEKNATVHGSKPVMDLLVTLCANYHLNPSDYTVEVLSPNKNNITFKPNSPIGLLDAEKIVLKPKAGEEKTRTPYMPEATVRLLINYNKSHKAVVRVNPRVPLESLLPVVCNKCELQVGSTVLLRDSESKEGLDLSKTLNEHGLREVYAKDTAAKGYTGHQQLLAPSIAHAKVSSSSSLQDLTKKEKKKSENKGFLGLFRKHRKKSEPTHALSAPSSPGPIKSRSSSVITHDATLCAAPTADMPKKRRAPAPPMGTFHSFPNNLSSCHFQGPQTPGETTLRSTKRKAPPPPPVANHQQEIQDDTEKDSLNPLEEEGESEQPGSVGLLPSPPSPPPSPPAPVQKGPDPQRPLIRGKDLSDARAALAKVLHSSLSAGSLVKRLKNTNAFANTESSAETGFEIKSILNTDLPTENGFEDPANKTGLTTFKVVPSRRESDVGSIQDVPSKEESVDDSEKTEQVIAETEKAEKVGTDIEKAVEVVNETEKAEEVVTEMEKAEEVVAETEKVEKLVNETEKAEEVFTVNEKAEKIIPGIGSVIGGDAPEHSESSVDEDETTSCPLQLEGEDSEDISETPKQDEVKPPDEIHSGQSHECVADEDDLYLADEEVLKEPSTELKSHDEKTEEVVQEDDIDNFPPPPPPVYFSEDPEETNGRPSVQTRAVTNGHTRSNSEPLSKVHSSEAADRATPPSRFAQAVALAVQRSRLPSTGKTISALLHQET